MGTKGGVYSITSSASARNDSGISACCARATGGHATAAPPKRVMNSRRPMSIAIWSVPNGVMPANVGQDSMRQIGRL